MTTPSRGIMPRYKEADIRRGLLELAAAGGNSEAAGETSGIPPRTLREWRKGKYAELYRHLHDTHGREIEQALVPEIRETAIRAAYGARMAVEKSITELETGDVKDPTGMARNLATVTGIAVDKLMVTTGRPTPDASARRDAADILASLARRVGATDTTATEIPE